MGKVKARILVAGAYNGPDGHNIECEVGDVIAMRPWYADKLAEQGLAEIVVFKPQFQAGTTWTGRFNDNCVRIEWTPDGRVGRAVQGELRFGEGGGDVHNSGVSRNNEIRPLYQ